MPPLNIARDFAGIAGRLDLSESVIPSSLIVYLTPGIPCSLCNIRAPSPSWAVQMLRPGSPEDPSLVTKSRNTITTWAGSIWHFSSVGDLDEVRACHRLLSNAVRNGNLGIIRQIEGDFVAAVITTKQVLLLRSLTSATMLFYRVTQDTIMWSTNFMDLVNEPFDDIDRDVLAFVAWGGNAIPYPGIETLLPGEFVCFNARGIVRSRFDDYDKPGHARHTSLADWGESARELILRSVAKRAQHFDKVGVLLSGGIDSSAIVRCLVDIGANVKCYNWASPSYPPADESQYARKVTEYLGVPLTTIDIGCDRLSGSQFLDEEWEFSVPYNHGLYRWWHETTLIAKEEVDCLMSGRGGDGFCGLSELSLFAGLTSIGAIQGLKFFWHSLSISMSTSGLFRRFLPNLQELGLLLHNLPIPMSLVQSFKSFHQKKSDLSPWRQIDYFTDEAQQAIFRLKDQATGSDLLQALALDINTFRPTGLVHISPYIDREIIGLMKSIPNGYRLLPYGGQLITKPVLRWAFLDLLPPEIIRRNYRQYFSGIIQSYCLNNREFLRRLFDQDAYLVKYGIVDPNRFLKMLEDRRRIQICASTIIRSSMVELWLKSVARRERLRC